MTDFSSQFSSWQLIVFLEQHATLTNTQYSSASAANWHCITYAAACDHMRRYIKCVHTRKWRGDRCFCFQCLTWWSSYSGHTHNTMAMMANDGDRAQLRTVGQFFAFVRYDRDIETACAVWFGPVAIHSAASVPRFLVAFALYMLDTGYGSNSEEKQFRTQHNSRNSDNC